MTRTARLLISVFLMLAAAAGDASGQWFAETRAGRVEPDFARLVEDGSLVGLRNVMVGARYEAGPAGVRFSVGLPTGAAEPLWATLGGWRRVGLARGESWFAGVDLVGNGFLLDDRRSQPDTETPGADSGDRSGFGLATQALPVIGLDVGRVQLQGRSGAVHYLRRLGEDRRTNTVWLSEGRSLVAPARWLAFGPVVRHYRPTALTGGHTYAGADAIVDSGRFSIAASLGRWAGRGAAGLPWSLAGAVQIHPRMELSVGRRRDVFDPVYLTAAQTSWSVGFSIQLSGSPAPPPVFRAAAPDDDGRVTIRLARSSAPSSPRIAGDFNAWQAEPMQASGAYWSFVVDLPPGVYNYAFVDEDGRWFVPESVPGRRDDGMGGHVAVLVVTS